MYREKDREECTWAIAMACKIGVIKPSGFADTKLIS